jgi:hypothetical protein
LAAAAIGIGIGIGNDAMRFIPSGRGPEDRLSFPLVSSSVPPGFHAE